MGDTNKLLRFNEERYQSPGNGADQLVQIMYR